jgi:hypothetical protein
MISVMLSPAGFTQHKSLPLDMKEKRIQQEITNPKL